MIAAVSIIGMGKLGAPMAACMAHKGIRVVGVDLDPEKVQKIKSRVAPVNEPGLGLLLRDRNLNRYIGDITATVSIEDAVWDTHTTFVVVATPSNPDGSYSLKYMLEACKSIGEALKRKQTYHLVVITSTVLPGDTEKYIKPALEVASGKKVGVDFGLCYSPEFIALGSVIRDFQNPDFILIGESDNFAGDELVKIYNQFLANNPPIERMNFVNAELTKIALNTFVTTKISYANMLSQICDKLAGANVDAVTAAVGRDSRIGPKYLRGGANFSGPCFPRDNRALAYLANKLNVWPVIPEATDKANKDHLNYILYTVLTAATGKSSVGILGLSYKPNSEVTEESLGIFLLNALTRRNIKVMTYEPSKIALDGPGSAAKCIKDNDVLVLATLHKEFLDISESLWQNKTVVDPWRALEKLKHNETVTYIGIGLGRDNK